VSASRTRAIRIAILAMGGEGGGVLADWIADLARAEGYISQVTSVPGVAQRTGATIYYLELFPKAAAGGKSPVLALMPVPGDVDIVIASELMEAARAVSRGLVTPDRTTLVASRHRVYAMTEKIALGDGRADASALEASCRKAAKHLVMLDMARIAEGAGSVISAVMLGALAASGALPFARHAFEAAIARSGVGQEASLRAFDAAFAAASDGERAHPAVEAATTDPLPESLAARVDLLPAAARGLARTGALRLIGYHDATYAGLYLDRVARIAGLDELHGDARASLSAEAARQLALAMSYEDPVRVAELKLAPERIEKIRAEIGARPDEIVRVAEFLHPRIEEIAGMVPAPLGRRMLAKGPLRSLIEALTRKGRTVETTSLRGFLTLAAVARLKRYRMRSLRHAAEDARIESLLRLTGELAPRHYGAAIEAVRALDLVKGYGDTHERGVRCYERVIAAIPHALARPDPAGALKRLREAASADDTGRTLESELNALVAPSMQMAAE
jgi:indolepyruvate ferredoxin oxidoreductase beta subunit